MKKILLLVFVITISSCANYKFIKSGSSDETFPSKEKDCPIRVLTSMPEKGTYTEVGLCNGTAPGGGVFSDRSDKAINQLKKCACENGGDAIVIIEQEDKGYNDLIGYSQQSVKARAIVISFKKY